MTINTSSLANGLHTVSVKVTSDNDCDQPRDTECTTLTADGVTFKTTKTDVTCNGANDDKITPTFGGGTAPYAIQIDGGTFATAASRFIFNKLTPGLHTVTVKDANGCTINDRKTITALAVVTCNLSQLNEDDEDDATATPNVYAGCIYCLNDEDVEHLTRYQIKPTIGPKEVVANYIIFGGPAAPDRAVSRWANP